jgi:WD40 repeat protein
MLPDGKVLIAGGTTNIGLVETVHASAELYDPTSGKFTPTGSMTAARDSATATLLSDGRVLIVGGYGCRVAKVCSNATANDIDILASAELYDPTTDKFIPAGSMTTPRAYGAAARLPNGRIPLIGGFGTSAELYDPTSGRFVRTGNSMISFARDVPTATHLLDGRVLVTGTSDLPGAEIYDPATGAFKQISFELAPGAVACTPSNGQASDRPAPVTATLLKDGRVLLYEYTNGSEFANIETYDPATEAFISSGPISEPGQWSGPTATLLADGRVLFAGSANSAGLYDPADGFHVIGSMRTPRADHTATLLPDGSVLIAGGTADGLVALSSAELFRP